MDFQSMMQNLGGMGGMGGGADVTVADTAETVHISSLALLKMLKHGERKREGGDGNRNSILEPEAALSPLLLVTGERVPLCVPWYTCS